MTKYLGWALSLVALGTFSLLVIFSIFFLNQEPHTLANARTQLKGVLTPLEVGMCHYELKGDPNDPLIVLIHGGSVTGMEVWNQNVDYLNDNGYQVLRFDLFGRGLSDFKDPLSLALYQNQLDELISKLEIKNSFHIAGLSMGAMVAAEYVARNPQRVQSMSLFAPAAMGLYKAHWTLKTPIVNDFMVRVYWLPRAIGKQMSEFYQPELHSNYAQLIERGTKIKGFKAATLSIWLDVMSHNRIKELKAIGKNSQIPAVAFFGNEDHLIPPTLADRYQEAIPKISVHVIDDAGHMPQYENPSQVNPLWLAFLSNSQRAVNIELIEDEK